MDNTDKDEVDFNHAGLLLHIVDKSNGWPTQLKGLREHAMKELEKISLASAEHLAKEKKEETEALAKKQEEDAAKRKAEEPKQPQGRDLPPIERSMRGETTDRPVLIERETFKEEGGQPQPNRTDNSSTFSEFGKPSTNGDRR